MKTIQLRRYVLVDGTYDDFVDWYNASLLPARVATGYTVEFAYGIRETNEFVWAVSTPGDAAAFSGIEEAYLASPERAAAFAGQPDRIVSKVITFVDEA